jgi:CBS domain-containing membrane protein
MDVKQFLLAFLPERQPVPWREQARTALAAGVCIFLTALISHYFLGGRGVPVLVLSMGASAILLFGFPASPLAQPWAFVGGHWIPAAVGITCAKLVSDPWLASALALTLAIAGMLLLRCLHPAGGAVALIVVLGGEPVRQLGYAFLWLPLSLNLGVMLLLALLFNNLLLKRPYPARRAPKSVHQSADPGPLVRLGLTPQDIAISMREHGVMLDVSRVELDTLFRGAQMQAAKRRLGEIRCRDIMSRDIVSVEFATPLQEAWRLLYTHKVNALPVIDRYRRVIGIITLIDFLKAAQLNQPDNLRQHLREFLQPSGKSHSDKAEVVGQIMTAKVLTAKDGMHIVVLIDLLSDKGMHHVPIVDEANKLCGMVTQSDLIAALFHGAGQA